MGPGSAWRDGRVVAAATWLAGPVLAWAVRYGRRAGLITAVIMSGCDLALLTARAGQVPLGDVLAARPVSA
jgi:hypothetical protein